ncbi:WD40-repeat-containing domain protein [Trichophaea hybrida]|nr:WD40-repeat-containing domain protein [Trichophaea hybrida]
MVTRTSATLLSREEAHKIPIPGNHSTIVKFSGPTDQSYKIVVQKLKDGVKEAISMVEDIHEGIHQPLEETAKEHWLPGRNQSEEDGYLSKLPCADGAAFNSRLWEHEAQCLPETRVDLLKHIITWSQDPSGACIFWLSGIAGTGKSTIARTVAHTWAAQNQLGASFFFSKGRGDLGHAAKFFTSLAAQLAITLPAVKPYVCRAIEQNPDIFQRGLGDQWKYLVLKPLSKLIELSPQPQAVILVIDALDECEGDDDTRLILRLLAEAKKAVGLRVFVTSRPETPVRFGFHTIPEATHQDFVLHNISQSIIRHDISTFLHHELENIRSENRLNQGWPGKENVELLCDRARGLFIYASTACRFIRDPSWDPGESLALLLKDDYIGQTPTRELDEMYTKILMHSIVHGDRHKRNQEKLGGEFKRIIGSIVILFDTLSVSMLARLLDTPERTISVRLRCLHSVLDVPESQEFPVRLLHPSFRDFLLDKERCLNIPISINEKKAHNELFASSLNLMSKHLKRDICNLQLPGTFTSKVENNIVQNCIPLDVQYACRYWIYHLQQSSAIPNVELCDNGLVHKFLLQHLLHWLEALSLIGKISNGVLMVRTLESMLSSRSDESYQLVTMVSDAKRFILNYRSIIETAPLQIYSSALVFSPRKSCTRSQFWNQTPYWIKKMPVVEDDWNASLQPLDGHSESVSAVAYSPDGHLLASASGKIIRLWDPNTGGLLGTLEGDSGHLCAVAFSPDGQLLASASLDNTVRLWDPTTGGLQSTLEGHSDSVWGVAFSPDGQLLASASSDNTVRLWDPTTGGLLGTLEGHSYSVWGVAFSPDGQLLASASSDNTVSLWDPTTGGLLGTLEGHSDIVSGVAFSPDGQLLASVCDDSIVRLWDPTTGGLQGTLEGHSDTVSGVAFSPDGQLLASASKDNTVKLWDPTTGGLQGTLKGHSDTVNGVAFSPDGQLLASASLDRTVRLWNLSRGTARDTLDVDSEQTRTVLFSSDSHLIASSSDCKKFTLCDPSTGASHGFPERHAGGINSIIFSPDGQLLASASEDNTVRLWNPTTEASQGTLEGHSDSVVAIAFSPDGQLLASASRDNTVRLWDPTTRALKGVLQSDHYCVCQVAFSPDGQLLASTTAQNTVRLWDPATAGLQGTLEGHSDIVCEVAFSPDSKLIASASGDNTIRLWQSTLVVLRDTLQGHSDTVLNVAFSLDGQLLASSSDDRTVRLWNISTKDTIQIFHTGKHISKLSFSNEGSYLETNVGILNMKLPAGSKSRSLSNFPRSLHVHDHWVTWRNGNIMWLPPDYRDAYGCRVAVWHNVLAMGLVSGRVTFIVFDLDTIPLGESF